MTAPGPDPFGTAALRAAVLASWSDSPTRFREDANAEEDLLLGGYGATWLVELAQNAADAAARAGSPGRLLLRLVDGELRVANTGRPLDASGVAALASLRASAKRSDAGGDGAESVGQFGVGFAAVLPLSAEPRLVSLGGGVRFSTARTAGAVSRLTGPARELARREGQLPVLRLAWPTDPDEPPPPGGFATEVRLPLRPEVNGEELLADAAAQAADLLLALPQLGEITVGTATLRRSESGGVVTVGDARWRVVRRSGVLGDELLGGVGVEQRGRRSWTLAWLLPLDADGTPRPLRADVLHAPTPTEQRLTVPARLVATLPVEPSRRRVRPGPFLDAMLDAAAEAYVELVRALPDPNRAALVPVPGFPATELDAGLRQRLLDALRDAAWLPGPDGSELVPRRALALDPPDDELPGLLADVVPELVAAGSAPDAALAALGVARLGPAELVDRLSGLDRPPTWWHKIYGALVRALDQGRVGAAELGALPVPLVDGRTVTGPASTVIASAGIAAPGLELPGLRIVHPDAEHPLLARLGARRAGAEELLDSPAVVSAVEQSVADADAGQDVTPLATAVLALVARLAEPPGAVPRPWLGALALPGADGECWRADELMFPDAAVRPLLADDAPLGVLAPSVAATTPREVLRTVGVIDGFTVLVDEHPTGPDHDLADEPQWWAAAVACTGGEPPDRLVAVRDLDLVADSAWPAALRLLAADPACRAALRPAAGGELPYTAWWLAGHARLAGRGPREYRLPSATALDGLYDPATVDAVPDEVLAAIGVRAMPEVADDVEAADLLDRLADRARQMSAATTVGGYAALAAAVRDERVDPAEVAPPALVRTVSGEVVDADAAVVLDRPWLADALHGVRPLVAGGDPVALADLLDLALASEIVDGRLTSTGVRRRWREEFEVIAACTAAGVDVPAGEFWWHEVLEVQLTAPVSARRTVAVWRDGSGDWHASDPVRGVLAVLAAG